MTEHFYALIMAGGTGTRLWPLSREDRPKQVLPLIGERTMFQIAVERLAPLFTPERIFVVAGRNQINLLRAQESGLPPENFIVEPLGRGTAPAIALGAIHLRRRNPEAVMTVLTADHYVADEAGFRKALTTAGKVAQRGYLVTLGVTPDYPATGYGYIERGESVESADDLLAYAVVAFREKPSPDVAERFLADGRHSWNSGMFIWRVDRFLSELARTMPEFTAQLDEIDRALGAPAEVETLARVWPRVASQTVDYGVMEKARGVAVIPIDIGWSDVGSWASLLDILPGDANGNVTVHAEHLTADSQQVLVHGRGRLVATIGLKDIIVVDTEDVLLVCPKDRAEDVRQLVERLKQAGRRNYL
ncbi:MAG TPA: mannose-1-phosphate guanylyltransferase [Anaerolineae bacterium]|nr:mannose-1-phosphate guanylyltransferase [Anaerolineae bacterium]